VSTGKERHEWARRALVEEIAAEATATASYTGRRHFSERVMAAMAKVPRHEFVPPSEEGLAYVNGPLPIGYRQTISQPYIVALMTDLLDLEPRHTVLEIGTGSGYQAAILSELAARVYSIEVVAALAAQAAERLRRLGYGNVEVRTGDGSKGWPEHAPFDAIIVTAAAPDVPPALLEQLKAGGRMAIPIGGEYRTQELVLIEKDAAGMIGRRNVLPVAFVPLTHPLESGI
jgi:protein-L-isoaspartate(D-aspartate) O-methyltransferase